MREQRQVVARLDVERGVHPEKVRDAVLITVRIVDKLPAPVMIFGDRQGDRPSRAIVAIQREAETMRELIVAHDRYFLDKIVSKIIELDNGNATVFSGN